MFGRSRSTSLLLLVMVTFTGCRSAGTQPRNHWWQFWRPKATATSPVYHPDTEILPPPPDVLGQSGSGTGSTLGVDGLPPPSTAETGRPPNAPGTPMTDMNVIHFDYDSSAITPENQGLLDQNAEWLKGRANYEVTIEGHSDERGTAEYNMNLGMTRAKAVRDYLIGKGVEGSRLHTISYGEERPLDPAANEAAYAKNRRVQFLTY